LNTHRGEESLYFVDRSNYALNGGLNKVKGSIKLTDLLQLTNYLRGAESFWRIRQLLSYAIVSQHFMETDGSLPCSKEALLFPCPESDQLSPYHPILFL
jgi:hypothetical protein